MNRGKINNLMKRYLSFNEKSGVPSEIIKAVEERLNIVLPGDFKIFLEFYSGESLRHIYLYNFFLDGPFSIIEENLNYRKNANFSTKYLVLYEEAGGIIVMETQDDPDKPTPVIYCSDYDVFNLFEGKPFEQPADVFPSFTDFFEYLLTEEEKERGIIPA